MREVNASTKTLSMISPNIMRSLTEFIISSFLSLVDIIVVGILFVTYYIYVQFYGERNLKDKYIQELSSKYHYEQINPVKTLAEYSVQKFRDDFQNIYHNIKLFFLSKFEVLVFL